MQHNKIDEIHLSEYVCVVCIFQVEWMAKRWGVCAQESIREDEIQDGMEMESKVTNILLVGFLFLHIIHKTCLSALH